MDAELTEEESDAVQKALRSYLSDLRMEITDTDNARYRADLRAERTALESALAKLGGGRLGEGAEPAATPGDVDAPLDGGERVVRLVRLWWRVP